MSSAAALARLTVVCSICIAVTALAARRYARAKGGQASSNTSAAAPPPAKTCVPPVTLPDKGGSGRSPGGHWKHAAKATSETLTPRSAYARVEGAELRDRVVVAMVGLPARGKSYLSKAVVRYLNLIGCPARIFNSEEHRKTEVRRSSRVSDPGTDDAIATRDQVAMETLDELFSWLRDATATTWLATGASGCACAIFDATNTTVARRQQIVARCADERPPVRLIFLESICDDDELLKHNYRLKLAKTKTNKKEALEDFVGRVKKYEEAYERIEPAEGVSYLQIHNAGQRLVASGLAGYVSTRIVALLHAIHLEPRAIWLTLNDTSDIVGGDSPLSADGLEYARATVALLARRIASWSTAEKLAGTQHSNPAIISGTLRRYSPMIDMMRKQIQPTSVTRLTRLNDLCAGELESVPAESLHTEHVAEREARERDKLSYRFPGVGGESYQDVIQRLLDTVLAIEQSRNNVVVVCDRAISRVLWSYLCGLEPANIPNLEGAARTVGLAGDSCLGSLRA
ncbi:hypothetical protein EMIHUDRAFT_238995 [Emiliania huxleyi CCMP1516]|uniref:6-phosphofructo-2-kinase domain-containing protein n=2 Tax=Emiliania huxleyi TaxID=2903 RepID=A0A0D3JK13_EMIH1|nr:hypothetical protein EMIHUDRAFT_238995 [Emiliania huxleyi CCMP1516]EOD23848.1 hypothetical protein EMIHUDRAFT_238995 [Emiliania huxleyi CCMP1516]|eukprot:XP_005776277.1 hypothetical protein EMIHUDRAFT_238995 [Emiliania huxleyi CCMP1516]